jgi:hypothetical protein
LFETPRYFSSASLFHEGRSGYFTDANEFFVKLTAHFVYELKCLLNLGAPSKLVIEAFVCTRRVVLHLKARKSIDCRLSNSGLARS